MSRCHDARRCQRTRVVPGRPQSGARHQAGLSLVELLLALALGLVVILAVVQLFVGNTRTYAVLSGQARMQENARFALEFIGRTARSAGYFGCQHDPDTLVRGLRGDWSRMPEFNVLRPVEGSGGSGSDSLYWPQDGSNRVHTAGNGIDPDDVAPGTDLVVFRSLRQPLQRLAQLLQPDGSPVVTAPGGDPGFGVDDVVMIADCQQAAVARITGLAVNGEEATLQFATGASGSPFENAAQIITPTGETMPFGLSMIGRSYRQDALVGAVESTWFYVAPGLGQNNRGETPLALWQKQGTSAPAELVQGIEDLQVLYGVDTQLTDGRVSVDRYLRYPALLAAGLEPEQIVAIRISVTANSVDVVTEAGEMLRRTVSRTILLRNASPGL